MFLNEILGIYCFNMLRHDQQDAGSWAGINKAPYHEGCRPSTVAKASVIIRQEF